MLPETPFIYSTTHKKTRHLPGFTDLHPTGLHVIKRLVTRLFTGQQRDQRQYCH
ncbi:hypothetical protein PanABDRAFT_3116 [Pantoea sp. aB]|nr:hypothetical protein PanABDRAFT_3116 [Pantoea sp. aB]